MNNPLERAIETIVRVADPDKIILFGSRAKGNAKPDSDYDIGVIKDEVEHRRKFTHQIYRSLCGVGDGLRLSLKPLKGLMCSKIIVS